MLKTRIIPTLLWKDVGLVKGLRFDSSRRVGTIMPAIKVYNKRQVDELILLDITATKEQKEPDYYSIEDYSAECFMPLTVGGGITNIEQIRKLLRAGADKICINSQAYSTPELITKGANLFGSQCIVVSIDAKKMPDGSYKCFKYNGTIETNWEPAEWAETLEKNGAGEILITSIDKDGTLEGYDIDLIKKITKSVKIPVIASGGAGNYEDMYQVISQTDSSAVAAASIFHFTHQTPLEAKKYLKNKGLNIRNIVANQSNIAYKSI